MKKFLILAILAVALVPVAASAQNGHEYSPLVEKAVNYKDWTYKSLSDGKQVNLRSHVQGKKLVMVVYFAPWCGNWKQEMPVAARLYEKYKADGLDVVGVSEYGSLEEVKNCFGPNGAPYTVVTETESKEDRINTKHYGYRQSAGDTRKWGSPWNIFLEPAKLTKSGDVLVEKAWVVNGELIEADVEKFIREQLGLETKAQAVVSKTALSDGTPCEPPAKLELKKP